MNFEHDVEGDWIDDDEVNDEDLDWDDEDEWDEENT
jgi:hypothetical protein